MKPTLRTLGWTLAVIWATGMTVAMARIAGTLDSLAARPEVRPVAAPVTAPADPGEISISLRAAPPAVTRPAAAAGPEALPATPDQEAAHDRAEAVLAEIVQKGTVDDDSVESLRQAMLEMRPEDRIQILSAFAAAATRGEIAAAPEDYRRILP